MSSLFLLAPPLHAATAGAAADLYSEINYLRSGGSQCAALRLPALRPQGALERVAQAMAQGGDLQQSMRAIGYRAAQSRVLSITGAGVGAQAAAILARQTYCMPLQHEQLTEVGLYRDARQLWIVMAAPFAPAVAISSPAAGRRVLDLVNHARATPRSCGGQPYPAARPVRWNETLAEAARLHSEDMARHNYFSHGGRDGSNPGQRVERVGYRYRAAGENIAGGQRTPEETVAGWIKSPGHCANLMNPAFTEMGAAYATDARSEYGIYWTQAFGAPR